MPHSSMPFAQQITGRTGDPMTSAEYNFLQSELKKALAGFRGLMRKSPISILECVLIRAGGGKFSISGTNLEQELFVTVDHAGAGHVLAAVPFERLHRFVAAGREAPDCRVRIVFREKEAVVHIGSARCAIPTLDAGDWANIEWAEITGPGFKIEKDALAGIVARTSDAAGRLADQPQLESILFDGATAVSTNRISVATAPLIADAEFPFVESPEGTKPTPLAAIRLALSACGSDEMTIRQDAEHAEFSWSGGRLRSKLFEGAFPPWRRLLSLWSPGATIECEHGALLAAVRRVTEGSGGDFLSFMAQGASLRLRCRDASTDPDAEDEVECAYDGDTRQFALNAGLALKALTAIPPDQKGTLTIAICDRDGARSGAIRFGVEGGPQWLIACLQARFYPETRAAEAKAA